MNDLMTPYQVAKTVNEMLTSRQLKTIPPQMVYNYVKKGLIRSENGHIRVEVAEDWAERYVAKKLNRTLINS